MLSDINGNSQIVISFAGALSYFSPLPQGVPFVDRINIPLNKYPFEHRCFKFPSLKDKTCCRIFVVN